MAEFVPPPPIQMPNMLQSYLQGRMAPIQAQQAQMQNQLGAQQLQSGALNMEQLKLALQKERMTQFYAQQLLGGSAGAQNGGEPSGGIQDGPQSSVMGGGPVNMPASVGAGGMTARPGSPMTLPLGEQSLQYNANQGNQPSQGMSFQGAGAGQQTISPATAAGLKLLGFPDIAETMGKAQKLQLDQAKLDPQNQNALSAAKDVATSANADQIIKSNPSMLQSWVASAKELGLDPFRDLTPANARMFAAHNYNKVASQLQMDLMPMPTQMQTVTGKGGYQYMVDPITQKPTEIPGQTTPYQQQQLSIEDARLGIENQRLGIQKRISEGFSGQAGELLAALTEKGVSLPAGMRSKEQQLATVQGLISRHPEMSPDEIADAVKTGKINMAAASKEATTAAGIVGRTTMGENELINMAPSALAISDSMPRGSFVPFNRLVQYGQENISDPNLRELYGRTQALLNAYDIVAARGGTDAKKREANRNNLTTADSPATYRRAVETMMSEAKIAKQSGQQAIDEAAGSKGSSNAVHWDDLK